VAVLDEAEVKTYKPLKNKEFGNVTLNS